MLFLPRILGGNFLILLAGTVVTVPPDSLPREFVLGFALPRPMLPKPSPDRPPSFVMLMWLTLWYGLQGQGDRRAGVAQQWQEMQQQRQRRQRERRRRWWRKHGPLQPIDQLLGLWGIRPVQWRRWLRRSGLFLFTCFFTLVFTGVLGWFLLPAQAATTIAIEPITWDFVGLDSNKPETQGPNTYVVGARVCNLGTEDALNVKVQFFKDGVDNGYSYIRLQSGDTYNFDRILADDGVTDTIRASAYVFDTRANGDKAKSKYQLSSTPQYCQDFYYNFEVTRTASAWNTYQKYYIQASGSNTNTVTTERPRQSYIEKLISQARNEVYFFGCDPSGGSSWQTGSTTVGVGDVFTCQARVHTATAYPQMSFTSDIPNVIFQVLDVNSTYSDPAGGVNSTVYADGCGWVNDPTDPRYHLSPGACSSAIISGLNVYSDQYPHTIPPTEGKGAVGNDIVTNYRIKVIAFPNGIPNPINVSNVILDYSGSSYHYNADYGESPNIIAITVAAPTSTDLSVDKSHADPFGYGNQTYSLRVQDNANGSPARSPVTLTDTLPAGYTFVDQNLSKVGIQPLSGASANNWNCNVSGQVLTCLYDTDGDSIGENFPDGGDQTLTLNINIPTSVTSGTTSTNFAKVSLNSAQTDSNTANNTDSDPSLVLPSSNLAIVKTLADGDTSVSGTQTDFVVGRQGIYRLTVTNSGNITAVSPTITDTLPQELSFVSSNPSCTVSGKDITCNLSDLAAGGASTTVDITVQVDSTTSSTSTTNTAKVSSTTYDSNLANNSSTITTPIIRPIPNLTVTKTPNQAMVLNKNYNFTVNVSNIGAGDTSGAIQVNEIFPPGFGMQYVSHSGTGWSCIYSDTSTSTTRPCAAGDTTNGTGSTPGTQSITFYSSGPIVAGTGSSSFTLTVKATADPGTSGTNTVVVSTPGETVTNNNTGTATVSVGKPDLAITKSHLDPLVLGQNSDYTVTVTNKVGSTATTGPITVTDTLPVGFTYQSHLGAGWLCLNSSGVSCTAGNTGTLTFYSSGPLAAGGSSSFTVTVSPATYGIGSATRTSPSNVATLGTVTTIGGSTAVSHGFSVGDQITVAGLTDTTFNGTFTILTVPTTSTFTYASGGTTTATLNNTARASGTVTQSNKVVVSTEGEASTTLADNTYNDPTSVTNSSSSSRDIVVEKRLTRVSGSSIALTDTSPTAITYGGVSITNVARTGGNTITITTSAAHGLAVNNSVNVNANTNTGVNGTFTVASVPSTTTFTYAQNGTNFSSSDTGTVSLSTQCALPLPSGASNADDFSGTGTNTAAINTSTATASRLYNCPALTAGQYVQYKIAVGSNQTSGSGRDIGIDFDDTIPPILQNVSWSCAVPEPTIGGGGTGTGTSTTCDTTLSSIPTYPTPEVTGTGNTISLPNIALRKRSSGSSSGEIPYVLITVVGQVNPSATASDLAVVSNKAQLGSDVDNTNNQWIVKHGTGVIPPVPDLTLTKTPATGSTTNYSQYSFTITPSNISTGATTDRITVTDTLPSGLDFVSASGTGWTCSASGQIVTCFSDTAIAGSSTSPNPITLTVQVNGSAPASTSRAITAASAATNVATITTSVAHGFSVGQVVTIAGVTNTAYNGTFTVASVPTATTFTYTLGSTPTASSGGTATNVLQNRVSISTPGETALGNNNASATVTITAPSLPDLTISKTHSPSTFTNGVNGTYTLTVNNTSTSVDATNYPLTVTDTLPANVSFVSASGTGWTCSNSGQIVLCTSTQTIVKNNGTVNGTATPITLTVKPNFSTPLPASFINNVRVDTTANTESSTTNNTASDTTPLQSNSADISITKAARSADGSAAATSFQVGQQYRYRLTVTNNSATVPAVVPLTITDQLPTNLTYLYSVSSDGFTCTATGQTVTCDRSNNLAPSATATVDLVVQVGGTASGTLTNQARVTSTSDPCADFTCAATNNRTTLDTPVDVLSDLAVVKTAVDQNSTTAGTQFYQNGRATYTIAVTNNGPSPYTGSIVVNENLTSLPFTYASHTDTSTWTCTSGGVACANGNQNLVFTKTGGLLGGESSTITLTVNVPDSITGTYTNTATIDAATLTAAKDTIAANNSDTETVDVLDDTTTVTLVKDDNDGPGEPTTATLQTKFARGGQGRYTVVAQNTGLAPAKAPITITDTLPSGLTYAGYSLTSNWDCSGSGQNVTCTYGEWTDTDNDGDRFDAGGSTFTEKEMAVGTLSGVEIIVNVASNASLSDPITGVYTGLLTNNATVSNTTGTSNFAADSTSEQTAIIEPADLAVTKTITPDPLVSNGTGTYTITVTNNGPGPSYADIYLQDYLPTGLTYTGATSGTAPGDNSWTILGYNEGANEVTYVRSSTLDAGDSTTINLPVAVASNAPGSVTNFVRVGGFTPEPDYSAVTPGYQDPKLASCDRTLDRYAATPDPALPTKQPVNNCDVLTTTVTGGVATDLKVTKIEGTNNDDPPNPGVGFNSNYSYTLQVANISSTNAETVTLQDVLAPGLDYVSHSIDAGDLTIPNPYGSTPANLTRTCSYSSGTRTFSCNLLRVSTAENDSDPVNITLTVKSVVSGIVPNTATVSAVTADSDAANNSESESVLVTGGTGNTVSGKVFEDKGGTTGTFDGTDTGTANITVRLYQDNDNDGSIDINDQLVATTSTDTNGNYSFITTLTGNFVVAVDTADSDLPASPTFTTATVLDVTLGTSDPGNDFGYAGTAQPGNVVFVKRITAINTTSQTGFADDTTSSKAAEDNDAKWPSPNTTYLRGVIGQPTPVNAAPGDEVEYTVYFLSNGGSAVRDVKFCDLIPQNTTYVPGSMRLGYDTGTLADPSGTGTTLTDGADGDGGQFYTNAQALPLTAGGTSLCTIAGSNNSGTNTDGAVFVQIVNSATTMPPATGAVTPAGSYGFVRFRVKVD